MTKIQPVMMREFDTLLSEKGAERFRRSDLSERLFPHTRPRSHPRSVELADSILQAAARAGRIVRTGHQHWMRASQGRTLKSGRQVAEHKDVLSLELTTHCPAKWVAVDLETGDIWAGSDKGWKRASPEIVGEMKALVR